MKEIYVSILFSVFNAVVWYWMLINNFNSYKDIFEMYHEMYVDMKQNF